MGVAGSVPFACIVPSDETLDMVASGMAWYAKYNRVLFELTRDVGLAMNWGFPVAWISVTRKMDAQIVGIFFFGTVW